MKAAREDPLGRGALLLMLGPAGQAEVETGGAVVAMPLDDQNALDAADPQRTGRVHGPQRDARERAMVENALGYAAPVVVIVLGGGHNLGAMFRARGADYYRVEMAAYRDATGR